MNWYFDTSVLIPAAVNGHIHNAAALAVLEELLSSRNQGFISAHSLTEFYSVLTRAPFKPPISCTEAWRITETLVLPYLQLVALSEMEYTEVIRQCALKGSAGGKIHDAVHLRCAEKAGCDRIYTFNARDFRALADDGLKARIIVP